MKKLYLIRTQDIFPAVAAGMFPSDQVFLTVGTLWADVALTDEQAAQYTFPKHSY